jgi:predicted peptidase
MSPFKIKTLQFFFCYLFCFVAISSSFSQAEHYSYEHYISKSKDTLRYRLLWPDANTDKKKFPLVIFLHGSGERGTDNQGQLKWGALNFAEDKMMLAHPAIVIAPQCPPEELWSNLRDGKNVFDLVLLPTPSRPTRILLEMIDSLKNRMPVDTNRIYITGLSMGGYGVYDIIERRPGLFAAAVPVCGGGDTSKARAIAHIPMWIFHGAEDPVVPLVFSTNMVKALTEAGAHPGFTQYPEVGHFSWLGAYTDPQMYEWMFRQRKK